MDLSRWSGVARPQPAVLDGRYAHLEPLSADKHGRDLFQAAEAGDAARFRYLFEDAPASLSAMVPWLEKAAASADPLFFAVVDKASGSAEGRQALMRIDPTHGVIEIGSIFWGPAIARTRVATEALYLCADHVFDTLGYRRFEWKCNDLNEPSKRAAERFGFTYEGTFHQHMVVKGRNRDTAWFAMTDTAWPRLKAGYEAWLGSDNFDADGHQLSRLTFAA